MQGLHFSLFPLLACYLYTVISILLNLSLYWFSLCLFTPLPLGVGLGNQMILEQLHLSDFYHNILYNIFIGPLDLWPKHAQQVRHLLWSVILKVNTPNEKYKYDSWNSVNSWVQISFKDAQSQNRQIVNQMAEQDSTIT